VERWQDLRGQRGQKESVSEHHTWDCKLIIAVKGIVMVSLLLLLVGVGTSIAVDSLLEVG